MFKSCTYFYIMLYNSYRMKNKIIQNIIPTVFAVMVLAIVGNSIQNIAFGQSNSNQTSDNLAKAEITGQPETLIVNKTTIPAEQTTITVDKTTSPVDQSVLQPLQNQTIQEQPLVNLTGIENKTVVKPTGQAQTTMLNTTTVPFEQTIVEGVNQTGQQQNNQTGQQQNNQTGQQGPGTGQQQQGQGNQSSGPLEKLGEAITSPFQ
jgi:hypothetical protein